MDINKFESTTEFEVIEMIAEGGMGQVFKARHKGIEGFEKIVAIKTMKSFIAKDDIFRDKFIDEAKLVANLIHENIVQIYQLGKLDDIYYFVLEFVNGISVHQFLEHHLIVNKDIPRELAVYICSRIARGLAYAHTRTDSNGDPMNIVHCDICPDNVLITDEGLPKITDFGIAKVRDADNKKGFAEGKPLFMAPEQARGEIVTPQTDMYSLGILLFTLLTCQLARDMEHGKTQIALKQAGAGHINWDSLPDDIDPDLKKILIKMLAVEPESRYKTTAELAGALEYHIYKDGYGPTIVTLANYMREEMPMLFKNSVRKQVDKTQIFQTKPLTPTENTEKTKVIDF